MNINLSDLIKSVEYVILETDTNCLVSDNYRIVVMPKEILAFNVRRCLAFDRKTGNFIKEIRHRGNDGVGYNSTLIGRGLLADDNREFIFFREWNGNISAYNIDTGINEKIPYTDYGAFAFIDSSRYIGTLMNWDGKKENWMYLYENSEPVDSIPTLMKFNLNSDAICILKDEDLFYRYAGKTYYKNIMNDTVYAVTECLTPSYIFYSSGKLPDISMKERPEYLGNDLKEKYVISNIVETERYIFYTNTYQDKKFRMAYDKKDKKGGILQQNIINDIDDKGNFWIHYITENGDIIFVTDPMFMDESTLKSFDIIDDNNPIVVIGQPH